MSTGWSRLAAGLLACLGCMPVAASETDCPGMPVPQTGRLQSIAQEMVVNGAAMSIRRFDSEQSPEQVLAFFRLKWPNRGDRKGNIEYPLDPWRVIATNRDGCFYTVQVQPAGRAGSLALLGVSRIPRKNASPALGAGFPMMAGSQVLNDYKNMDSGKSGRLLVFKNQFSSTGNAAFYRTQLAREGWLLAQDITPDPAKPQSIVLVFRRGGSWADMTIDNQSGATSVIVNIND